MPKVKIPRKSTIVDMTAMCDVAFLLLSFFILATKQKPDEALAVNIPNSVSSKVAPDKAIIFTLTEDGRSFLTLGDDTKKKDIIMSVNQSVGLGLSGAEVDKLAAEPAIGMPFNELKGMLALNKPMDPAKMSGIPTDSSKNELTAWVKGITTAYAGTDQKLLTEMLLVKGDGEAKYPAFKQLKEAFKANDIFKYRIVTNGTAAPLGSELYIRNQSANSGAAAE